MIILGMAESFKTMNQQDPIQLSIIQPNINTVWQLVKDKKLKKNWGDEHVSKLRLFKVSKWSTECIYQKLYYISKVAYIIHV